MGVSKHAKNRKSKKPKTKRKSSIVDVPLSSDVSLGEKATEGDIRYNFQKYESIFLFLKELVQQNSNIRSLVCLKSETKLQLVTMLVTGFNSKQQSIPLKPLDSTLTLGDFQKIVNACKDYRFVPVSLNVVVPKIGSHSNLLLFDMKKRRVELFEPHGSYSALSELESIPRGYVRVSTRVKHFVTRYFPDYTYVEPKQYEPKSGLQGRLDVFTGACIPWCMLYLHYRFLNPNVSLKRLTKHMDKVMTKRKLLRYIKYTEDLIKHKQ